VEAPQQEITPESLKVLAALRDQAMNGYLLLSKSGLDRDVLETSLRTLTSQALVRVAGDVTAERLGESYFSISREALNYVDQLLGRIRLPQYK